MKRLALVGLVAGSLTLLGLLAAGVTVTAQPPGPDGPPPFGPGGPGGFPGGSRGGPGGFGGQTRKLVKQFDADGDGRLNATERKAARAFLKTDGNGGFGRGPRGFGPPGFGRGNPEPPKPGPRVSPADAEPRPGVPLYEPTVLRTLFLEFENPDWERELEDFHGTDVEVPCTLTVDGKKYPNVGVHFRGMSSYMGVRAGWKRSLNLSLDYADKKQRLYGYKTLNLLNNHEDPSQLCTVLYSHIARQYIPAPKANLVRVAINGESWGVYTNAQQFDKVFLRENYKTTGGTRWKVRGNPGARGGLEYTGENVEDYKRVFQIKSGDDPKAWRALIHLCKVLNETPADKLEEALRPVLDVDGLLWFLALDVALINGDGYWTRASDYSLYRDPAGKFHLIPSDMNEAFHPAGGPGFGPPGGRGGFGMRSPQPGELLPPPVRDALRLTDAQAQQLAALQKETDGKLDRILTAAQRKQLKELRERGPGGFGPPGGPGGGGGVDLDPLVGLTNSRMPLRGKVLAVPSLRAQYLRNVRAIAEKSLDWKALGPVVAQYRTLIGKEVEADTRKLESFEAFQKLTADDATAARGREFPLRAFADQRRKYLLAYREPRGSGR